MKLEGKTALVTGGGGGIGRATALALAQEGAQVVVADIVVKNAEMVRDEIKTIGRQGMVYPVDLTKRPDVEQMMNSVITQFGHVDILANCAGWDRLEPFVKSDE
ncbi:MAG: SDR family NAD(P)-dependent oxidoreductase, partial [Candidatus Binatia bacterium]